MELAKLQATVKESHRRNADQAIVEEQLRRALQEATAEGDRFRKMFEEACARARQLETSANHDQELAQLRSAFQDALLQAQCDKAALQQETRMAEARARSAYDMQREADTRLRQLEHENRRIGELHAALESANRELKEKLKLADESGAELAKSISKYRTNMESKQAAAEDELHKLQFALQQATTEGSRMRDAGLQLETDKATAHKEVEVLRKEFQTVNARHVDSIRLNKAEFEHHMDKARNAEQEALQKGQQALLEKAALEKELTRLRQLLREAEQQHEQVQMELRAELERSNKVFERKLKLANDSRDWLEKRSQQIDTEYSKRLQEEAGKRDAVDKRLAAEQISVRDLQARLAAEQATVRDLQARIPHRLAAGVNHRQDDGNEEGLVALLADIHFQ